MAGHDEVQLQALFADGDRQIFQKCWGTHVSRHLMSGTAFLYLYFVNFVDLLFISQFSDFLNSDDAPEFQMQRCLWILKISRVDPQMLHVLGAMSLQPPYPKNG